MKIIIISIKTKIRLFLLLLLLLSSHVHSAGGLCIADEVQSGYGRIGSHFWAFEQQGKIQYKQL